MSQQADVLRQLRWIAKEYGYRLIFHRDFVTVIRDSRIQDSKSAANFSVTEYGYRLAIKWLREKAARGEL